MYENIAVLLESEYKNTVYLLVMNIVILVSRQVVLLDLLLFCLFVYYYSLFVLNLEINILLFFFSKELLSLPRQHCQNHQTTPIRLLRWLWSRHHLVQECNRTSTVRSYSRSCWTIQLTIASKLLHNDVVSVCVCVCVCVCVFVCVWGAREKMSPNFTREWSNWGSITKCTGTVAHTIL